MNIQHTSTRNFPSLFNIGNNHDVRMTNSYLHNVDGAGYQVTSNKGPAGAATTIKILANISGTGTLKCNGISGLTSTQLPRVPTLSTKNNMLADGSFEQNSLVDSWFVLSGGLGTLATSSLDFHTGTKCLQVPITSGVSTAKQLAVLVPKTCRFIGFSGMFKLSAGSGSADIKVAPVVCKSNIQPGVSPTIDFTGAMTTLNSVTPSTSGWVNGGIAGNIPRYELPEWATHVLFVIDCYAINNNGGNLYVDDVQIEAW